MCWAWVGKHLGLVMGCNMGYEHWVGLLFLGIELQSKSVLGLVLAMASWLWVSKVVLNVYAMGTYINRRHHSL